MNTNLTLTDSVSDLKKLESVFKGKLNFYKKSHDEYINNPNSSINSRYLKKINENLNTFKTDINSKVKKHKDFTNQHNIENATTNQRMILGFKDIQIERDEFGEIMDEMELIKQNNHNQKIRISQGFQKYIVWGIIALITMFITVKMFFFPESDTNIVRLFFNACILILLILWTVNLSSVVVTFIVLFLIAIIVIGKFKQIKK